MKSKLLIAAAATSLTLMFASPAHAEGGVLDPNGFWQAVMEFFFGPPPSIDVPLDPDPDAGDPDQMTPDQRTRAILGRSAGIDPNG